MYATCVICGVSKLVVTKDLFNHAVTSHMCEECRKRASEIFADPNATKAQLEWACQVGVTDFGNALNCIASTAVKT